MTELSTLIEEIPKYQPGADLALLERAYRFSEVSHQGQQRASGEPYLSHPLEVASLLVGFKMDVTTVTAGLLHDVLEDTAATKQDLEREFGKEIAELVDGVTKIGKLAFSSREERQAENFRKMLVAMARDLRVLMIKLADRLHNMRTLDYLPTERARKVAQETLDIYAPLAHRLGMAKVKAELEDLALRSLQPDDYLELQRRVAKRRLEREADINHAIAILEQKLSEVGIESQIRGRPKHFFSIWKKMHDQGREFDEIYDLTAVRVITNSVRDCYGTLGVVHSLWKPVPGRFKDFVAMPKVNMYQSLHTTVIGPKGDPVEIQIRTWEMHRIAEEGIAAHWLYKEKKSGKDRIDDSLVWLRQLLENQQDTNDPAEFLDSVRVDLFPDEVYVFTPKGDVKALPEGSTPIDFAYAVHTKVGEHTVGSKVNGKLVPLRTPLRQGDIVEIVTSPNQHPSRDWLKIVKSSRARSKINQWLKVEERVRSIELGREMFEREAKKYRLNPTTLAGGRRLQEGRRRPRLRDGRRPAGRGGLRQGQRAPAAQPSRARGHAGAARAAAPAGRHAAAHRAGRADPRRGRSAGAVRQVLQPAAGRRDRRVHHAGPRPDRARPRLPDGGQERARSRAAHQRRVGRGGARHPPGPDRRLYRARSPGVALRDHRRHLLPRRQHHQGRGHGHRRPPGHQQLRGRGRRPGPAAGHHGRHPRGAGRHQRRARPRLCEPGADDNGPSAVVASVGRSLRRGRATSRSALPSAPRIWAVLVAPLSCCVALITAREAAMTRKQFEVLVEKALRTLPAPFKDKVANIAVVVEDWADDETLEEMGIEPPDTLYGLYRGVDITQRDSTYGNVLPDVITIYQGPIEEDAADQREMAEIVRETVMHELGHYFGLDDDTMHRIEDGEA